MAQIRLETADGCTHIDIKGIYLTIRPGKIQEGTECYVRWDVGYNDANGKFVVVHSDDGVALNSISDILTDKKTIDFINLVTEKLIAEQKVIGRIV